MNGRNRPVMFTCYGLVSLMSPLMLLVILLVVDTIIRSTDFLFIGYSCVTYRVNICHPPFLHVSTCTYY